MEIFVMDFFGQEFFFFQRWSEGFRFCGIGSFFYSQGPVNFFP